MSANGFLLESHDLSMLFSLLKSVTCGVHHLFLWSLIIVLNEKNQLFPVDSQLLLVILTLYSIYYKLRVSLILTLLLHLLIPYLLLDARPIFGYVQAV